MSITRPDIAFYTKILAQNLKNPGLQYLAAGYRYVDYLKDIKYLALEYGRTAILVPVFSAANDPKGPPTEPAFVTASDAAFTNDVRSRQSTEGIALKLFSGIFDWLSRLQSTITTSTTEAELLAIVYLILWIL